MCVCVCVLVVCVKEREELVPAFRDQSFNTIVLCMFEPVVCVCECV